MKMIVVLLLSALVIALNSCGGNCEGSEKRNAEIIPNMEIEKFYFENSGDTSWYFSEIESTSNFIFSYRYEQGQCMLVFDDEFGYQLKFNFNPEGSDHFIFKDAGLSEALAYYNETGAEVYLHDRPISTGTIEGTKISEDSWEVNVDVVVFPKSKEYSKEIKYEAVYILK